MNGARLHRTTYFGAGLYHTYISRRRYPFTSRISQLEKKKNDPLQVDYTEAEVVLELNPDDLPDIPL